MSVAPASSDFIGLTRKKKGKEKKSTPLTRAPTKEGKGNRINVIGTDNGSSQKGKKKMTTFLVLPIKLNVWNKISQSEWFTP